MRVIRTYIIVLMFAGLALGQTAPASTPASSGSAQSGAPSTTPSPVVDDTATASPFRSTAENENARRIQPGDYLAPFSKMRWGPFSLQSIDSSMTWSNQPLGLNGSATSALPDQGLPNNLGTSIATHSAMSMSAHWRWGTGFVGFQYTPSVDYQTATDLRQINHNISLFIDHPFRFGKWRMTVGVHSSTANQLSSFYEPPPIIPLFNLDIPITNRDLIDLLTTPTPLQPQVPKLILLSHRFVTGSASASLSRRLSGRDTLSITGQFVMNKTLDFGTSGPVFNYPQSSGGTVSAIFSHYFNGRQSVSLSLSGSQTIGSSFYPSTSQQSAQLGYTWSPWRTWGFTVGAGPSRITQPGGTVQATYVSSVSVTHTLFGAAVTLAYNKGFELQGFTGGQDSKNLNVTWAAPRLHGHKWQYSLTTGLQLAQSLYNLNGQGFSVGSGFNVALGFAYPVTRQLSFQTSYGYFFQNISNAQLSSDLTHYQRNVASAGLHYSFGGVGARY